MIDRTGVGDTVSRMTSNLSSKKVSAAAARRERQAQLKAHRTVVPLPTDCVDYLDSYRPEDVSDEVWGIVAPVFTDVMSKSKIVERSRFVRACSVTAHFLVWCHTTGRDLDVETVFMPDVVEGWLTSQTELSSPAVQTYRSRLRSLGSTVNQFWPMPAEGTGSTRKQVDPPYTATEMELIVMAANGQPSATLRQQLQAIVGLCAGAGLGSEDLRALRRKHVELTDNGILVRVPGRRERTTVVLEEYEPMVRNAIEGLRANTLVIKEREDRSNVTGHILERATTSPKCPDISTYRLRTTWLTLQMRRKVSLKVLMSAAGLETARTLSGLVKYVDQADPDDAVEELRGVNS